MTSTIKRQQLVNELRKAHFSLGYNQNKDIESEYVYEYKQKMLAEAAKKDGNPREHHYEFGSDDPAYLSEFKDRYPDYQNPQQVALSDDKKKDLRKQHFVLGYQNGLPQTTYTNEYYKKNAPHEQNEQNSNVRKHMHDFGDSLTYFSSMYKQTFNKNLEGHKIPEKVPIDANALRKTNMVLGNQNPHYQTQSSATYVNRSSSAARPIKASDGGISLGNEKSSYMSSNKMDYAPKYNSVSKVDKEKIRDFKSAHFKLGSPSTQNNYLSEHQNQYNTKPLDGNSKLQPPESNVNLKMDFPNDYNSIYKGNYHGLPADATQPIRPQGELNSLGSDPSNFQSEAKANFIKHPLELSNSLKQAGNKSSLQLGSGPTDYLTQYQDIHRDRFNQLRKNQLSKQDIDSLKDKHFEHGYKGPSYDTTNSYYGRQRGPAGKLSDEQLLSMKRNNIYDPEPDGKKNTIYKTSFHWKANQQY